MAKPKQSWWRRIWKFFLILVGLNLAYILLTKWVNPPITLVMVGSLLKGQGLERDYIPFEKMGNSCKLAVIAAEDQLFPRHHGFDVEAIQKAIEYNEDHENKPVRGGSTISQQTAKNVFLWNGRNWIRKGLEAYHTLLIELIWGKQRILETYLNVAEMGKGIFGIQAAARHYFRKDASNLTRSEAAWIAAILPNPVRFSIEKPNVRIIRRHNWILKQMNNLESDPELMAILK